jgi:hypothetical protein
VAGAALAPEAQDYVEIGERNALTKLAKWGIERAIAAIEFSIGEMCKGVAVATTAVVGAGRG